VLQLRDQLTDAGFEVLFTCTDDACGGFDFRFATPVLPTRNACRFGRLPLYRNATQR
jgi:hypothetical protein